MDEEGATEEGLEQLQAALGYSFKRVSLLSMALTHRSHSYESGEQGMDSYERLEFLGDALLGFIVADRLYREDDLAAEGILSRRRQFVVRSSTLAAAATKLRLGEAIRLGRGEELTGGRRKASLLADLFEAVLGAIYIDGGIRPARAFVRRHLGVALQHAGRAGGTAGDFKTELQERVQARLQLTPRYRIVTESGPAHARHFEAEVLVGEDVLGLGSGSTRKSAEQEAARKAIAEMERSGDPRS
jgi:ribonuclease-3